jgi:superfamily II DNA helicase RecQ
MPMGCLSKYAKLWQEIGRAGRDGMAAKAILMDYRYMERKSLMTIWQIS